MYVIYNDFTMITGQTSLSPNQRTGLKVKNLHSLGIFKPILLTVGVQAVNGGSHHMYVIYKDFSMLTCQTGVPPNQPTGL